MYTSYCKSTIYIHSKVTRDFEIWKALVHPRTPESGGDWTITEDTNFITLRLKVGAKTTKDEMEVTTTDDQVLLVIRYKKQQGDGGGKEKDDNSPKSSLPVQLLMPPGCDHKKVNARLFEGWLEIIVAKPTPSEEIPITQ
jgi:HSP20 family molecular chaperone IbpA